VTSIYFISWVFIGNYILLNLFLAILLDAFSDDNDLAEKNKLEETLLVPAENED
jgi:hypothetical protein